MGICSSVAGRIWPSNPVGVLYEGNSAIVIAQDVLSDWVQIEIPVLLELVGFLFRPNFRSDRQFGVLARDYFDGLAGCCLLRNCTYHEMYILPGEIILPSLFRIPGK